MSGTRGSSGLGSVSIEQIDRSTVKLENGKISAITKARSVYAKQTLGDGKRWRPLVTENVQADAPVRVDIRVVDLGREADFGGLEWVIGREGDGKEEDAACVW